MGIGFSIFLFVIGAILTFAVEVEASGFNLNMVGIILMVGGPLGLFASVLFWTQAIGGVGAGRLANADSEPPHRPRAGTIPTRRSFSSVADGRSPRAT